jgi:uncharacterized protein YegL
MKTTADTKGDWRPLVFLMTDGARLMTGVKALMISKQPKKVSL